MKSRMFALRLAAVVFASARAGQRENSGGRDRDKSARVDEAQRQIDE